MAEGSIKFECRWTREPIVIPPRLLESLGLWRAKLRRLGLLGVTADGVGFGNISVREGAGFVITGSATGALERLEARHYALVEEARADENWLSCRGLSPASSESLSHAAVYAILPRVCGVIHVHCAPLWERLAGRWPTTPARALYGTPAMAAAIAGLAAAAAVPGLLVMGGHRDGLISYAESLEAAGSLLVGLMAGG